jgi:hypothetical protein
MDMVTSALKAAEGSTFEQHASRRSRCELEHPKRKRGSTEMGSAVPIAVMETALAQTGGMNSLADFTVKIVPQATTNEIQSAAAAILNEINKNKPVSANADVSVSVQADQKK